MSVNFNFNLFIHLIQVDCDVDDIVIHSIISWRISFNSIKPGQHENFWFISWSYHTVDYAIGLLI